MSAKKANIPHGSGVYCLWSKALNRPMYVGSTNHMIRRRSQHAYGHKFGKHTSAKLTEHTEKYGHLDLQFQPLVYCNPDDLIRIEGEFIESLGTMVEQGGCNTRIQVETNLGIATGKEPWNKGKVMDEAYRLKASVTTKAAMADPAIRAKISEAKKGKPSRRLGIKTGKPALNVKAVKATNLSTGETFEYPSLKVAGASLNLKFGSIWAVCQGKFSSLKGYSFAYKD